MPTPIYQSKLTDRLTQNESNDPILIDGNNEISTYELIRDSKSLAARLYEYGLRQNDKVVLAVKPGVEFLKIVYANMFLQTRVAIIDPEMGKDNYIHKLKQWDPRWAFVDSGLLLVSNNSILRKLYLAIKKTAFYFPIWDNINYLTTGIRIPGYKQHVTSLVKPVHIDLAESRNDSHDFIVVYTSGTTSEPKAVVHSFESLDNSFGHMVKLLGDPQGQRIAAHLPHFMLMGVNAKIPVYLWNYEWSAKRKLGFIRDNQITTIFGPPADYLEWILHCEKTAEKFPSCLKHLIIGSAPIYKTFLQRLLQYVSKETEVTCFYGMTENLFIATIDGREKVTYASDGDPLGKPIEDVELKIKEDGELMVKSPQLFTRYYHMESRSVYHESGDLVSIDNNGYLVMQGRKKDMILRRHQNIYPSLYEPTILKINGVQAAAIVGKYSEQKADEEVYLFVESTVDYSEHNFRKLLMKGEYSIDKEALPDYIVFCKIPRSGRQSKIDKDALRNSINMKI